MAKHYASIALTLAAMLHAGACHASAHEMSNATAISEVFGDGAKITTAIISYTAEIDGSKLSTATFSVEGREITNVYASATPDKGSPIAAGKFVVIELKTQTELKAVSPQETQGKMQGPVAGQTGGGPGRGYIKPVRIDTLSIRQLLPLYTVNGSAIEASDEAFVARSNRTLIADDFLQATFYDNATGINLKYNLYIPKTLDPNKTYPLVLFIHDASGAGKEIRNTLLQGNGATVWASPESQAKHPCFVVAPQFDQVTVDDDFNTTPDLDACLSLIDSLIEKLPIDTYRVYTTGQSMGCMSSYVLLLRRPELFASAMLVAGQWNPDVMASLAKKNLWLLSCKGDVKSSEGVAQAIEVWKQNGATVVEQEWQLDTTAVARDEEVKEMLRLGGNIHYTHFAGGSHNNTWRKAYDIEGVRDWLFAQHRPLTCDSVVTLMRNTADSTIFVIANHGDSHAAMSNSIQAINKAIMKGATLALVDVAEQNGELLLGSGEKLETAIDQIDNKIILLANPASADVATDIEALATAKGRKNQFMLYGSAYGTTLNHMARINLDKSSLGDIDKVLQAHPIAVELNYADDSSPMLDDAIKMIRAKSRLCFNTTQAALCGSHADQSGRTVNIEKTWGELIDMGGTLILTNQIKPLLNWLSTNY